MTRPDTAANIREHFLKLLEDKAYDKVSTKEIAESAGISRQTLYRHYGNKEEIIRAIFDDMFEVFYEQAEPHFSSLDQGVVFSLNLMAYTVMSNHKEAFMVLARSGADEIIYNQLRRYFRRFFGALLRHTDRTPNEESMEYVLDMVAGGSIRALKRWALGGMKQSPQEMARIHATFFNNDSITLLAKPKGTS